MQLKEMKLTVDVYESSMTRTITDMQNNVIWEDTSTMSSSQLDEMHVNALIDQMSKLPVWNIVEVVKTWH